MSVYERMGWLAILGLVFAVAAPADAQLYVSPKDNGVPGAGPGCIPIGAGDKTLALWIDGGSTATQGGDPCDGLAGTPTGDELCMFDYNIGADAGISIVSFTPDPGSGIGPFHNVQLTSIRFNGGDPINGTLGPVKVGDLVVNASAAGNLTINGETTIDTLLTKQPVSGTLASAGLTSDGDLFCDIDDPCASYANVVPIVADANGDGIPDECQCGDTNGDGFLLSNDVGSIFACGNNPLGCATAPPDADLPPHDPNKTYGGLWDTNLDGMLLSNDASAIFQLPNLGQEYLAKCGRRPEGTPPP